MGKGSKRRRAVELLKDGLIVLLTCSALWLAVRAQLVGPLGLLQKETSQAGTGQTQGTAQADAASPLRITVSLMEETGPGRYGIQYDQAETDSLFQQVAGLLAEALSSAGEPQLVSRSQWERALITPPAVCFDFQGEIPLSVLTGWMTGEESAQHTPVRRLVLTVWEDSVALYYRNEEDGHYYRCLSEVASSLHLEEALADLRDNGAFYAFESEQYDWLDPDTLLTENLPVPAIYQTSNPASGGRSALESLMELLGLPVSSSSFYSVGDEWVARIGGDTLRLSAQGVLEYHAEEGSSVFAASSQPEEATLLEMAETCRRLAAGAIGTGAGQGRLYLSQIQEGEEGFEVEFEYCLNGIPVQMEDGAAAWFLWNEGRVVRFILHLRSYTDSGKTTAVLPLVQASAAMKALGLEGEELLLLYTDNGDEQVSASWAAVNNRT